VAITGGSAGGHLSSLAALSANEPEFQPGFEEADTSVVAAVPFYGVYDWTNRDGTGRADMEPMLARFVMKSRMADARDVWEFASTMTWVRPDAPPFMIIHGTNDTPGAGGAAASRHAAAESKKPVVYAELPGAQHAFELFDSPRPSHPRRRRPFPGVRPREEGHLTRAEEAGFQAPRSPCSPRRPPADSARAPGPGMCPGRSAVRPGVVQLAVEGSAVSTGRLDTT
jgi:acetyl esterase/lipase